MYGMTIAVEKELLQICSICNGVTALGHTLTAGMQHERQPVTTVPDGVWLLPQQDTHRDWCVQLLTEVLRHECKVLLVTIKAPEVFHI